MGQRSAWRTDSGAEKQNTPAWRPDWGGALRCHVGPISRDIWGDGGRLVLLHEVSFELLESSRPQTVLILQLQPMETFSSSRRKGSSSERMERHAVA
ncbi:unnamed protein product [Effrenium voratum]|nr:unnamed protein product [Effrenium voratum]